MDAMKYIVLRSIPLITNFVKLVLFQVYVNCCFKFVSNCFNT